jgi:hypothetical protein
MEPAENVMNNTNRLPDHPSNALLASFGDPALGPDAQEELALHLDSCAACQARLERMEPALAQYAHCLDVVHSRMSRSKQPFPEFSIESIQVRKKAAARPKPAAWRYVWGGAIAASVAGLVLFSLSGNTSELRAETLLTRASQAPVRRSAKAKLRIRTQNASFIRPVLGSGAAAEQAEEAVREHFAAANYDWRDPLSAQSYMAWRNSLKTKTSKVSTPQESEQEIETTTTDGTLRDASLTFDAKLVPVGGMFRFSDQQWVEITTLPDPDTNRVADVGSDGVVPQPVPAPPAVASTVNSPREPVAERELNVRVAIDLLHTSASEPIEVSTSSGDILVTAYNLTLEQEKGLHASLDKIGGVVVRTVSDPVGLKQSSPTDRAEMILRASHDFSFEAHQLGALAGHFPPAVEATLTESSKINLLDLRAKHAREMNRRLAGLQQLLQQESTEFRVVFATPPTESPANGIQDLATGASSLDRALIMIYAGDDPKANAAAWTDISGQVSRLGALASQYSRYLEEERKKRE